jgi:general secretion pathway protein F
MALYAYRGLGPAGKPVAGVKEAESPKAVRALLRRDGVVVTDVNVSKGGTTSAKPRGRGLGRNIDLGPLLSRVKKSEIAAFTRQLATLLQSGIPLAEALTALFDQTDNVRFKEIVGQVKTQVNEGASLGDAMAKHPRVFDDLFVSMTRAGEVAGNLDEVLLRLADFLESGQRLRAKVQGAMIYPIIMVLVASTIVGILMVSVMPRITAIFEQRDAPLPWNTELLMWFTHVIGSYWYVWVVVAVGGTWGLVTWSRSPTGRPTWHRFLLKLPLFGPLIRQVAVSRFARTLATMLSSGVTMLRAIDVSKETLGNTVLVEVVNEAREAIAQGESIAVTLRRSGHFPSMMTHMIAVGERAGELESMLFRVADTFDREVDSRLDRLTSMLQPLMLVLMGLVVAFIVFSILMPIMDMSELGF